MVEHRTVSSRVAGQNLSEKRRPRVGLSRMAEARLREKLRWRCPSAPWIDAQFKSFEEFDRRGQEVLRRYHDPSVFPPGGAKTLMVRCAKCGVPTPPNAMENGDCLDHAEEPRSLEPRLGWGRSPSAIAIEALQFRNLRLIDSPLAPESTAELREEIERARARPK